MLEKFKTSELWAIVQIENNFETAGDFAKHIRSGQDLPEEARELVARLAEKHLKSSVLKRLRARRERRDRIAAEIANQQNRYRQKKVALDETTKIAGVGKRQLYNIVSGKRRRSA